MTTFSQLVDKMVNESKRPDLRSEISTYLNQTIRELHMEPERGKIVHYRDNLKEDILYADSDSGFSWDIPDVAVFQNIVGCRFDTVVEDNMPVWAREILQPNRAMDTICHWFYRSGTRVFFKGYGGVGGIISLSWYEYLRALKYYPVADRPAVYDEESGWTYSAPSDLNDATRLTARNLTSNWILLRWPSVLEEGLRAKVYKRLSDTERARTSYSMYQILRSGFYSGETEGDGGSW